MKKILSDLDYVEIYAKNLKENKDLFKQHAEIINSQLASSQELFKKRFGKANFKENAREYLRSIRLIN